MRISDWSSDVCSSDLIPFFVAGPMGLVGMYLRSRMEDTPIFREIEMAGEEEQSTSAELKDLLLGYWQPLLIMGGMVVALNVVHYTLLSYMPTYLQRRLGLSTDDALIVPIAGMLFMLVLRSEESRVGKACVSPCRSRW